MCDPGLICILQSQSCLSQILLLLIPEYTWGGSWGEHSVHSPSFDTKLPSQGYELLLDSFFSNSSLVSSHMVRRIPAHTCSLFSHENYILNTTSSSFSAGKSLGSFRFACALPVRHANEANKRLIWWKYMMPVWVLFNNEQMLNHRPQMQWKEPIIQPSLRKRCLNHSTSD